MYIYIYTVLGATIGNVEFRQSQFVAQITMQISAELLLRILTSGSANIDCRALTL